MPKTKKSAAIEQNAEEMEYVVKATVRGDDGKVISQELKPTTLSRALKQAANAKKSGKFLEVTIVGTDGKTVDMSEGASTQAKTAKPSPKTTGTKSSQKAEAARKRAKNAKAKVAEAKSSKKSGPPSATKVIEACLMKAPKNGIDPRVIAANLVAQNCGKTDVVYVLSHVRSLNVGNRKTYGEVTVDVKRLKNGNIRLVLSEKGNLPVPKVDVDVKMSPAEIPEVDQKRLDKAANRATA